MATVLWRLFFAGVYALNHILVVMAKTHSSFSPPQCFAVLFFCAAPLSAQTPEVAEPRVMLATPVAKSCNDLVLAALGKMPVGGGYETTSRAMDKLRQATASDASGLTVEPAAATPSFCSGATYLVFLSVVQKMIDEGRLRLSPSALAALPIRGQADGVGMWGRWNANGPGTARLFFELGLGRNFLSFDDARPGDFMKIFWSDEIGSREFGHSVIYLGRTRTPAGVETIQFWSSNKPGGYGERSVPSSKIKRVVFSRLEHPERLATAANLGKDAYLVAMLRRPGTPEELREMIGVKR